MRAAADCGAAERGRFTMVVLLVMMVPLLLHARPGAPPGTVRNCGLFVCAAQTSCVRELFRRARINLLCAEWTRT